MYSEQISALRHMVFGSRQLINCYRKSNDMENLSKYNQFHVESFITLLENNYPHAIVISNNEEVVAIKIGGRTIALKKSLILQVKKTLVTQAKGNLDQEMTNLTKILESNLVDLNEYKEEADAFSLSSEDTNENAQTQTQSDWKDLPKYYEEGEKKDKDSFVYAKYSVDVENKATNTTSTMLINVFPERVPRSKNDKVKTVAAVKYNGVNKVFIGGEGTSVKIDLVDFSMSARVYVNDDNFVKTELRDVFSDGYELKQTLIKDMDSQIQEKYNSHFYIKVADKDVHIYPMNFEANEEANGCADVVALVGKEEELTTVVPALNNTVLVTDDNDIRYNLQFYWRDNALNIRN